MILNRHNDERRKTMKGTDRLESEKRYLWEMIQSRYGDRLSEEALEEVKKGIEGILKIASALRSVPLSNGDEPMMSFTPFRKES